MSINFESYEKAFKDLDQAEFADWLSRGLQSFYTTPKPVGLDVFDGLGVLIDDFDSVSEGLAYIYNTLCPDNKRIKFRRAIGNVLRRHTNSSNFAREAFRDLIVLIGRIKATESLNALMPTLGASSLGKRYPGLFFEAIAVLKALAPETSAYRTMSRLIDSANFTEGYIFEATSVLVECEPSQTVKIVIKYEPRMTQLRNICTQKSDEDWEAFCEAADNWAQHLLMIGPKTWVMDLWNRAEHLSRQNWLFYLLQQNSASFGSTIYANAGGSRISIKSLRNEFFTRRYLVENNLVKFASEWMTDQDDPVNKTNKMDSGEGVGNAIFRKISKVYGIQDDQFH